MEVITPGTSVDCFHQRNDLTRDMVKAGLPNQLCPKRSRTFALNQVLRVTTKRPASRLRPFFQPCAKPFREPVLFFRRSEYLPDTVDWPDGVFEGREANFQSIFESFIKFPFVTSNIGDPSHVVDVPVCNLRDALQYFGGLFPSLRSLKRVVAMQVQRHVFGKIIQKLEPFRIERCWLRSGFLQKQKSVSSERDVREHLGRNRPQELFGESPFLVFFEPAQENVPTPAIAGKSL